MDASRWRRCRSLPTDSAGYCAKTFHALAPDLEASARAPSDRRRLPALTGRPATFVAVDIALLPAGVFHRAARLRLRAGRLRRQEFRRQEFSSLRIWLERENRSAASNLPPLEAFHGLMESGGIPLGDGL